MAEKYGDLDHLCQSKANEDKKKLYLASDWLRAVLARLSEPIRMNFKQLSNVDIYRVLQTKKKKSTRLLIMLFAAY